MTEETNVPNTNTETKHQAQMKAATTAQGAAATITAQMKELVEVKESFKEEQLKFIKGLINPDLTDNELYMFLVIASKAGLNPFNKEIIAVVYSKDKPEERRVNYIVTRDGKRAVAGRKGGLEKVETKSIWVKEMTITVEDKKQITETVEVQPWQGGKLWGARSTVIRNGQTFESIVALSEYNTGKNVWATKPETMIKKVAESQALSQAVPELLGLYDESERFEASNGTQSTQVPQIEGGTEPADESQLETLKVMGADMTRTYTKQEAAEEVARLATQPKGKKKA